MYFIILYDLLRKSFSRIPNHKTTKLSALFVYIFYASQLNILKQNSKKRFRFSTKTGMVRSQSKNWEQWCGHWDKTQRKRNYRIWSMKSTLMVGWDRGFIFDLLFFSCFKCIHYGKLICACCVVFKANTNNTALLSESVSMI